IYARRIELAAGATFRAHPHPDEALLPSLPVVAITTPPGGAALVAGSESADPALAFALAQNQPTPFRTRDVTVVRFTLPEARGAGWEGPGVGGWWAGPWVAQAVEEGCGRARRPRAERRVPLPAGCGPRQAQRKMILVD